MTKPTHLGGLAETLMLKIPLSIANDHPVFAGHFPGRPIVPGALLMDLAVCAVEQATERTIECIAQAKFLSPAMPGDPIFLSFECTSHSVRFDIITPHEDGERKLASGRFALHAPSNEV